MGNSYVPPHARRSSAPTSNRVREKITSTNKLEAASAISALERDARAAAKKCGRNDSEGVAAYEAVLVDARALVERCARSEFATSSDADDARFALGEIALEFSKELERLERRKPLAETSREEEQKANTRSHALALEALRAFEDISERESRERLNGVATALSRVAELENDDERSMTSLHRAVALYDVVSSSVASDERAQGDILPAMWNCADARLKLAEKCSEKNEDEVALASYRAAVELYQSACGFCDAKQGDDLGAFLYDWGCSWTSFGQFLLQKGMLVEADTALKQAIEKLKSSANFSAGSAEPLNALGDALQTCSELLQHTDALLAEQSLRLAIDEAYVAALKLNSTDLNAHIGLGETHMALAASCAARGDEPAATRAYREAWNSYNRALMLRDSGDPGSCDERFGVIYNAACAGNRAGEHAAAQMLLRQLLICGGTTREAIECDDDLSGLCLP